MSKIVAYGAVGEEGCEFTADTEEEVKRWIDTEVSGEGHGTEPLPEDYYYIYGYTQDELDNMIEV